MNEANKNLLVRIGSAVVLIPVVIACIYAGTWPTAILMALASVLMAEEFTRITLKAHDAAQFTAIAASVCPALTFAALGQGAFSVIAVEAVLVLIAVFVIYLLRGPLPEAPQRISLVFTAFFYTGVLPASIVALRGLEGQPGGTGILSDLGMAWVVIAFLLTWSNDTGAYVFGRTLGRRKLYPAVSPGKSWEGFWGGMLTTVGAAFLIRWCFGLNLTWTEVLLLAFPVSVLGPLGDLSESMIKRAYGVKDSGRTIPGHGGVLDRLDAMLFTAPYIFFFVSVVLPWLRASSSAQ